MLKGFLTFFGYLTSRTLTFEPSRFISSASLMNALLLACYTCTCDISLYVVMSSLSCFFSFVRMCQAYKLDSSQKDEALKINEFLFSFKTQRIFVFFPLIFGLILKVWKDFWLMAAYVFHFFFSLHWNWVFLVKLGVHL